ncbi:hypothetical protein BDF20DRAFT_823720, partial [Mycotypha africana]|uniref:uncharacterized protein n=1 Tax=Mycotypha africana TaxID=64632 RepID=UPI002300B447
THSVFKETMSDIEARCEKMIYHAEIFKAYELSLTKHQYEQDASILELEYESQRHNLHDIVLQAIEERKKLVKEDKDESDEFINVKDLFKDAYARIHQKQRLRKRMDGRGGHSINSSSHSGHHTSSPSRQENSSTRRRRERQTVPHNIHAQTTSMEEEELELDFMTMKGLSTAAYGHDTDNSNNTTNMHIGSSPLPRRSQHQASLQHQRR